jgi:hypothetical protein
MYELIAPDLQPAAAAATRRSPGRRDEIAEISRRSRVLAHPTGCGGEMQATRAARRATNLLTATPAEVALAIARAVPTASGLARLTLACRRFWVKSVAAPTTSSGGAAAAAAAAAAEM